MGRKKLVVLSGAGVSAESGVKTFRDEGGLWEGHDVMEVASPMGWSVDREKVLDFYNQRRRQLRTVEPNKAHRAIAALEKNYDITVITQNVDDLHERAGSTDVLHLHGELKKVRSTLDSSLVYEWEEDLVLGDKCERGSQLRPHVVWFGEEVPMIPVAARVISDADIALIVGTSMQVYPAAGLIDFAPENARIFYIDPKPNLPFHLRGNKNLTVIEDVATKGMERLFNQLTIDN